MNFERCKPLVTLICRRAIFQSLYRVMLILMCFTVAECSAGVIQLHGSFNGSGYVPLDGPIAPDEMSTVANIMPKFGAAGAGFIPVMLSWSASDERFFLSVYASYPTTIDETKGNLFDFSFKMSAGLQPLWELHFRVTPTQGAFLAPADTVQVTDLLIHHSIGPHGEGPGHPFFLRNLGIVGLGGMGGGPIIRDSAAFRRGHQDHEDRVEAILSGVRELEGLTDYTHDFKAWTVSIGGEHVPEPGSFAIMGAFGLGGAAVRRWRQRK